MSPSSSVWGLDSKPARPRSSFPEPYSLVAEEYVGGSGRRSVSRRRFKDSPKVGSGGGCELK